MSLATSSYPSEPKAVYVPLVRQCDDPRLNFEKIRDKKLWAEHDARKFAQQMQSTKPKTNDTTKCQPITESAVSSRS